MIIRKVSMYNSNSIKNSNFKIKKRFIKWSQTKIPIAMENKISEAVNLNLLRRTINNKKRIKHKLQEKRRKNQTLTT